MDSHYKRLQHFFSEFELYSHHIARIVVSWLDISIPQPWVLSIDQGKRILFLKGRLDKGFRDHD